MVALQSTLTLTGANALTLAADLAKTARWPVAGATLLTIDTGLESASAAAAFAGATALAINGRINSEPNIFGAVEFSGETGLVIDDETGASFGMRFVGATSMAITTTLARSLEFGFTFYVDILDSALAQTSTVKRYTARLLADGVDVPIQSFTLSEPEGKLGAVLNAALARPLTSQIALAASLSFDIGVWTGATWTWISFIAGGKLASRAHSLGFASDRPTDSVSVAIVDALGDRMGRSPRYPVTLYDPEKIEAPPAQSSTEQFIYKEDGTAIAPVHFAVGNLSIRYALDYAYRIGCGYTSVETNLPDAPVSQVSFSMDGGFDGGVRALVSIFEPLFFTVGETLWIFDTTLNLPAGFSPVALPLSAVVSINDSIPALDSVNALVVSFREDDAGGGEYYTDRFEQEFSESGVYGNADYTKTETTRRVREYRTIAEPTVVIRSLVVDVMTTVLNHNLEIIHRETQVDTLDALSRKSAHTRTIESLVPDLGLADAPLALLTVQREQCSISYRPNPLKPGESVQDLCITRVSGLIHVDNDNTYRDKPFKLPLLDAHRNGFIDAEADQTSEFRPIKTTIEQLRQRGDNQLDVSVIVIDHLANTTERSSSTPRTGAGNSTGALTGSRTRRVMIETEGTSATGRRIPTLDAGELPGYIVLPLARKKLAAMNVAPRSGSIALPSLDLSLRKGSIVLPASRVPGVALGTYIVTGRTITGAGLGTGEQSINMSLSVKELK